MVDIESGPARGLRPGAFHKVEDMGRYEAWVAQWARRHLPDRVGECT